MSSADTDAIPLWMVTMKFIVAIIIAKLFRWTIEWLIISRKIEIEREREREGKNSSNASLKWQSVKWHKKKPIEREREILSLSHQILYH